MTIKRMDNVGIVLDDLDAAIPFYIELGLELEGRSVIDQDWAARTVGLPAQRVEVAMMRTPDGHSKLELMQFHSPAAIDTLPNPPVNTLRLHRVMFAVDDIKDTVERLRPHGGELIGEITQFEDMFLLCYLRGPAGIVIGLAEELK